MFCSQCGTPNNDAARFCEKCGTALAARMAAAAAGPAGPGIAPPPPPATGTTPPPNASTYQQQAPMPYPQQPPVAYADPRLRGTGQAAAASTPTGKSPGLAVLLSFLIPGVGQFYCGDSKKGGIMLAIYFVSWLLVGFGIGFIGILGVWLWSMIDAYNLASGKTAISK